MLKDYTDLYLLLNKKRLIQTKMVWEIFTEKEVTFESGFERWIRTQKRGKGAKYRHSRHRKHGKGTGYD
jgi:hypothetical protein